MTDTRNILGPSSKIVIVPKSETERYLNRTLNARTFKAYKRIPRCTHARIWIRERDCRGRNRTRETTSAEVLMGKSGEEAGRAWRGTKTGEIGGGGRAEMKEKMNIINTMHHIPATSRRGKLFIAREMNHGEMLEVDDFSPHTLLWLNSAVSPRERRCLTVNCCLTESFRFCLRYTFQARYWHL